MKDYIPLIQTAVWAVLALAILLFFGSGIKERMKAGGSVKFGSWLELGELKTRVDNVQSDVKGLDERVRQLYLHTMSEGAYNNLEKIVSKHFGPYNMGVALDRELRFLRESGFIKVESISRIPKEGPDLSQHVSATKNGEDFVALREAQGPEV
jgi:hypothetical protein